MQMKEEGSGARPGTSWRSSLEIDFDIFSVFIENRRAHVMVAKFWGKYLPPGGRREGGGFMAMVVAAALAWERGPGIGLVVDLSDLEYSGGDRLFLWKYKVGSAGLKRPAYKVALVQSPRNQDRIRSLLEEEEDQDLMEASFDTLDSAIHYVISETSPL